MNQLRRRITVWQGTALAVSLVIGSGLLGLPGLIAKTGVDAGAVAWVAVALAAAPLIAIFSKLGLTYATAAGLSRYAEAAAGPWAGYAAAIIFFGGFSIGIPALALIGGSYAQSLFGLGTWAIPLFALAFLGIATAVNVRGIRMASVLNGASVVALIVIVVAIVALKAGYLAQGLEVVGRNARGQGHLRYLDVWRACALLFWAYLGWEGLSFGLEEFRDPKRSIPMVYWLSFFLVAVLYLFLGLTTTGALDSGVPLHGAAGLAALLRGNSLGNPLIVVMLLVIMANANAWVFGASRLVYAAGRRGIMPRFLGKLSRNDIPVASLGTLFCVYAGVILVRTLANLPIDGIILLVNQNLLVLYAFSIVAYWKVATGPMRWVVSILATGSWAFLLSGFTWWIVYPAACLAIGYWRYRQQEGAGATRAAEPAPVEAL